MKNNPNVVFWDPEIVPVPEKPFYEFRKRLGDIIFSSLFLILLSPLFLIVSLIVRLSDGGSPFYVSTRVTRGGKEFRMFKFRSMRKDADRELASLLDQNMIKDGPAFKMKNDPRITPVGAFLRKTSIDELPQLLNILLGDMSFVGPRPPLPEEVARYTREHKQRLAVKQGLTCYWQCGGRNDIGFEEWVRLDLKYIRERSFPVDWKILIRTIGAVITMKGAE